MSVTWFNGDFVADKISLDPADRGLTLGDGVFETVAVRQSQAVWLAEHLSRMRKAAAELGIMLDLEAVRSAVESVLRKSSSVFEVLRITLTRGVVVPRALTGYGTHPSLLMTLSPMNSADPQSIRLAVSTIRRNETAPSSRLKTLSYIDAVAAAREIAAQADDALMLNTAGHVASTTIGNVFILRGDELITPQVDQGILNGITRTKLLCLADELGLKPVEKVVALADLRSADGVFRSNSLRLVTPVTMLDGKLVGGRSVQFIKDRIETLVGRI